MDGTDDSKMLPLDRRHVVLMHVCSERPLTPAKDKTVLFLLASSFISSFLVTDLKFRSWRPLFLGFEPTLSLGLSFNRIHSTDVLEREIPPWVFLVAASRENT